MARTAQSLMWSSLALSSLALALLAGGCAMPADGPGSPEGRWRAVEFAGVPADPAVETTLEIAEDGTIGGTGGCNRYGGQAGIAERSMSVGPVAATKMLCPPAQMDQERRFFGVLERAAGWRIEDGELVLLDAQGNPLMRLRDLSDDEG